MVTTTRLAVVLLLATAQAVSAQTAATEDSPVVAGPARTSDPVELAAPSVTTPRLTQQSNSAASTTAPAAEKPAAVALSTSSEPVVSTPAQAAKFEPAVSATQPAASAQPAAATPAQPPLEEPATTALIMEPATGPARPADPMEQTKRSSGSAGHCPPPFDTQKYKTTAFADTLKATVSIHPERPSARVPLGGWIQGRATHYGADQRLEAAHVACGEPEAQFGVIEHGSCGYTNSDGSLPFPREMYAAVADTNEDYPGSCGRCYEVRCKTGAVQNNGRALRISDLPSYRPYEITDNAGRDWPGDPKLEDDIFWTKCWDDSKVLTVRVGDSCPCQYPIKDTSTGKIQEIRTQNWCCGGNNHFDLSFWAFEQLAHPSYGVIPIEYRPVACDSGAPILSLPGFVNQTIFEDSIQPGWTWMPYNAKNTVLLAKGEGIGGSTGTCTTLSKEGAVQFLCRQCSRPGYQPFVKAKALKFDIRSNSKSADPYASSTPAGELPVLKVFLMNADKGAYCGTEVILTAESGYATKVSGDWYRVNIPLSAFGCDQGSAGGLAGIDRVDLQNINTRDADICLDNIALK